MVVTKRPSYKVLKKGRTRKVSEATSYDEAEIARLVEKAAAGSFEAFGEIYNIYLDRIYRYVFYQVKDRMTAEDLIEEIFVKAWKAIGSYRGEGQALLEAISCLRDNQRQVIMLKFIEGLDNREIAQIMGKSQGAIRILQMRALATLRKRLSSEE